MDISTLENFFILMGMMISAKLIQKGIFNEMNLLQNFKF